MAGIESVNLKKTMGYTFTPHSCHYFGRNVEDSGEGAAFSEGFATLPLPLLLPELLPAPVLAGLPPRIPLRHPKDLGCDGTLGILIVEIEVPPMLLGTFWSSEGVEPRHGILIS